MKPTAEQNVQWFLGLVVLGLILGLAVIAISDSRAEYNLGGSQPMQLSADSETAIGDGRLRERFRSGLLFRQTPEGQEVLFDGTIAAAIRWTAIAVCMTVGGSVIIVFLSLLRPFLKRE